jgi:phosphoglucomutase
MTHEIKFGTDGWRGKIADDYTFDNVRRCTQGFADYLKSVHKSDKIQRGVVVGGDSTLKILPQQRLKFLPQTEFQSISVVVVYQHLLFHLV